MALLGRLEKKIMGRDFFGAPWPFLHLKYKRSPWCFLLIYVVLRTLGRGFVFDRTCWRRAFSLYLLSLYLSDNVWQLYNRWSLHHSVQLVLATFLCIFICTIWYFYWSIMFILQNIQSCQCCALGSLGFGNDPVSILAPLLFGRKLLPLF